jgi:hypothetical protein
LKFVQLYTSKSYENRRNELINPPETDDDNVDSSVKSDYRDNDDDSVEKHVLSPRLVNAIYQTAQVVWANSHSPEGLIGRSDIQLQTAVGVPVAVDSTGNMCIALMFSPNIVASTDDAMEYLHSICLSATSCSIPCLVPVFNENASHGRQIFALPHSHNNLHGSNGELGEGVTARFVSLDEGHNADEEPEVHNEHNLSLAPKDTFGIPMLPCFAELRNTNPITPEENIDIFDEASYGIWNTIMDPEQIFRDEIMNGEVNGENDSNFDLQRDLHFGTECPLIEVSNFTGIGGELLTTTVGSQKPIYSDTVSVSGSRKVRLEEFCQAFLGMSVFDIADVWIPADSKIYPDCIQHVTSVLANNEQNEVLHEFNTRSSDVLIKFWTGAVGRAFSSGNPVWSANSNVFVDPGRSIAFTRARIQTVLAVPVFTGKEGMPSFVVAFYSLVRSGSVPFVLRFVQQALRLLWDGLEKIKPHESIEEHLWHQIEPADLGEMAADLEMQQTFLSRKRRHETFSLCDKDEIDRNNATTEPSGNTSISENTSDDRQTNLLASSLQHITLPSGEIITVPLQLDENYVHNPELMRFDAESILQAPHKYVAVIPLAHTSAYTKEDGSKRAHVTVGQALVSSTLNQQPNTMPQPMLNPLPMPCRFPTHVISSNRKCQPMATPSSPLQLPAQCPNMMPSASMATIPSAQFSTPDPLQPSTMQEVCPNALMSNKRCQQMEVKSFKPAAQLIDTQAPISQLDHQPVETQQSPNIQYSPQQLFLQHSQQLPEILHRSPQQCHHVHEISPHQSSDLQQQPHPSQFQTDVPPQIQFPHRNPEQQQNWLQPSHNKHNPIPQIQLQSHDIQNQSQQLFQPNVVLVHLVPTADQSQDLQSLPDQRDFSIIAAGNINSTLLESENYLNVSYCIPATSGSDDDTYQNPSNFKCCRIQGCTDDAVSRRPYCIKHSGNRLCEHTGCPKCAQGSTRFCIAHGGGRRCTYHGCDKGARDKLFCAAHGGGKRCNAGDCSKSAVGGSSYCTAHGGGRRCCIHGCEKSAQSSTKLCVKHGGGKKCAQDGCEKVARGRTDYCAAHGGGVRCKLEGCNRVAIGKLQLCRKHGGGAGERKKSSIISSQNNDQNDVFFEIPIQSGIVRKNVEVVFSCDKNYVDNENVRAMEFLTSSVT